MGNKSKCYQNSKRKVYKKLGLSRTANWVVIAILCALLSLFMYPIIKDVSNISHVQAVVVLYRGGIIGEIILLAFAVSSLVNQIYLEKYIKKYDVIWQRGIWMSTFIYVFSQIIVAMCYRLGFINDISELVTLLLIIGYPFFIPLTKAKEILMEMDQKLYYEKDFRLYEVIVYRIDQNTVEVRYCDTAEPIRKVEMIEISNVKG